MPSTPGPALLVAHAFLPQAVAGTEIHTYHLARHLGARRPVAVFHALRDPARAQGSLDRARVGDVAVWRLVQNYPYRALGEDDGAAARAFERVLDAERPAVVHFHHLANLDLGLPELARRRGARVVLSLHDYHLLCPSGGQLAAHPEGGVCARLAPARCAACHEAHRHREGALEAAALRLGSITGGLLPPGWPFALYQRLPEGVRRAARRLNPPGRARQPDGAAAASRLEAARRALGAADVVLSPSRDVLARFAALGMAVDQGRHLPNGVPDPWASPGEDIPPVPSPLPEEGPVELVHIGTLAPHKGIDLLVDAAAGLDPRRALLTIYGSPDTFPAYAGPLVRRARSLDAVRFAGTCAPEEVGPILRRSHALVLAPRWPENAPLTILDARAAGRPVIAPAIGGLPEGIRDGVDGLLFPPGDAAALGETLARFVADAPLRAALSAAAAPPWTAAAHARAVEELYAELGVGP